MRANTALYNVLQCYVVCFDYRSVGQACIPISKASLDLNVVSKKAAASVL
jgi:hypothetical protein